MTKKRPLPSTQSTQSTQSSSADARPPAKRSKIDSINPIATTTTITNINTNTIQTSISLPSAPNPLETTHRKLLPPPPKRVYHPGTLRRLAVSTKSTIPIVKSDSIQSKIKVRPKSTLSGSKIGGKSKDLNDDIVEEEIWVNRTVGKGLGFAGYLKKGVKAVLERGMTTLRIHGMGAAVPLTLSLSLAIRDALTSGSSEQNGDDAAVLLEIRTGSVDVGDEITPLLDTDDMVYQTRTKSTVEIILKVSNLLAVNASKIKKRGTDSGDRGSKRRGMRGGRGGSGRGRGRGKSV